MKIDEVFFEEIFGTLGTDCGYSPEEIRAMTLLDVSRLFNHWKRFPSVRTLVAGFMGFEPKSPWPDTSKHLTADEFANLVRQTGGGKALGLGRS